MDDRIMAPQELSRLLRGAAGVSLTFSTGDAIPFDRHELESPAAWRAAMRRQLGHIGYRPPVYGQDEHDDIVRAMFALADAMDRTPV